MPLARTAQVGHPFAGEDSAPVAEEYEQGGLIHEPPQGLHLPQPGPGEGQGKGPGVDPGVIFGVGLHSLHRLFAQRPDPDATDGSERLLPSKSSLMDERNYLILGATGGLGTPLTRLLTSRGDRVLALGRNEQSLEALHADTGALPLVGDARDSVSVEQAVKKAVEEFGRLDGAACLVGSILLKPAHGTRPEEFEEVLQQNLMTAFHLVRAAAPAMGRSGGGSLVLMSSAAARIGLPSHEAIAAAKAGVEGLTRSAAATYASRGVRVNAVAPGLVRTPLSERIISTPAALAASESMHPMGRIGEPEDGAELLAWLLSSGSSWVTGQTIGLDGGLSTVAAPRRS